MVVVPLVMMQASAASVLLRLETAACMVAVVLMARMNLVSDDIVSYSLVYSLIKTVVLNTNFDTVLFRNLL